MSTLESCTDALLQQKVVQTSNYERLESRLMEMERTKRSLFFGLKEVITDVERRSQDLGELKQEGARQQQQLQQGGIKFSALTVFLKDEWKKAAQLRETLEGCETSWTGCPARIALLVRALQEYQAFRQQLNDVVGTLSRLRELVFVLRRVETARLQLVERLDRHSKEVTRLENAHQEQRRLTNEQQMECKQRSATAAAESERLRSVVRQLELLLLCREAELTSIREETTAVATRNNICDEALQSALAIVDVRDNRQEVVQVQLWFVSWYCKSFGLAIAAFEDQAAAVSEVMNTWMEAMRSQRDKHQKEAERVDRELALLEEEHKRTRTTDAALQKRRSSLRLLAAALRFFRCRLQGRAAAVRSERVQWEAELSTARKADEDRRLTRRLLLLQKEAREGLCAEELLTRGMLTNNEDGERREVVCQKQLDMDMLKEQQLQAGESQRRCEGENETVNDCYGQETPAKPAARRRRAAVHTDKRQLGVQSKLTSQVQKAFPNCSKAISPHDNNTQQSSWKRVRDTSPDVTTSSQPFLITRTLVNPFDSLNHRREASGDRNESPLPRQAMTNMPLNDKDNGKKRHQLRNGLHVPTGRLSQINDSPLPRLPNGKTAPVHRDLAPKNVNVVTKATSAVNLGSDPPEVSSQHRARPSLLIEKDTWSSGKSEDIFADIFPF